MTKGLLAPELLSGPPNFDEDGVTSEEDHGTLRCHSCLTTLFRVIKCSNEPGGDTS